MTQVSFVAPEQGAILVLLEENQRLIRELAATAYETGVMLDLMSVRSPADLAAYMMPMLSSLDHEEVHVVLLNTRNMVIEEKLLYRGTINACQTRVAEIFRDAILKNAAAIILVHNHPTGDPSPSPEDVHLTRKVREAGDLLDIELLDHLIIGGDRFVSLRERGLGFE